MIGGWLSAWRRDRAAAVAAKAARLAEDERIDARRRAERVTVIFQLAGRAPLSVVYRGRDDVRLGYPSVELYWVSANDVALEGISRAARRGLWRDVEKVEWIGPASILGAVVRRAPPEETS